MAGNMGLVKSYDAGATVNPRRIVKPGAADYAMIQAAAATDALMGVSVSPTAIAAAARVDVQLTGIVDIDAGGAITRGGPVTADANGKAVAAAPGAGTNNRIIGFALISCVANDIVPVQLAPGSLQG